MSTTDRPKHDQRVDSVHYRRACGVISFRQARSFAENPRAKPKVVNAKRFHQKPIRYGSKLCIANFNQAVDDEVTAVTVVVPIRVVMVIRIVVVMVNSGLESC